MKQQFILLIFTIISAAIYAQTDSLDVRNSDKEVVQKKFDNSNLDKYKKDKDFIYTEEKTAEEPSFLQRVLSWLGRKFLQFLEWIFGVKHAKGIFGTILTALPYIIALLILFLIVRFFLKVNLSNIVETAKNKPIVVISEEEELLKHKDLSKMIDQAINQKNYRLAVRYFYLKILKQLEDKELIIWEQQKTNEDYKKEIKKETIKKAFDNLTRLYDFIWYGNFEINEIEYSKVSMRFEEALKLINKKRVG